MLNYKQLLTVQQDLAPLSTPSLSLNSFFPQLPQHTDAHFCRPTSRLHSPVPFAGSPSSAIDGERSSRVS